MRTTVSIDDQLLAEAKVAAARTGRSLSQVVEDALRTSLDSGAALGAAPTTLPVFGGSGFQPGVDLEDRDALAKLLADSGSD